MAEQKRMRIGVGADHAGLDLKSRIVNRLRNKGYDVEDFGTMTPESCDYPSIAFRVGEAVASGKVARGVLVCGSGIGMSIAANKVRGVRAALCLSRDAARLSRSHNDANVLCLPGRDAEGEPPDGILDTWLETEFSGQERHARRLHQISDYENR